MKLTPKEIAYKALELITKNLDNYNQHTWHCGTSHCFMGFVEIIVIFLQDKNEINKFDRTLKLTSNYSAIEKVCTKALNINTEIFEIIACPDNLLSDIELYLKLIYDDLSSNTLEDLLNEIIHISTYDDILKVENALSCLLSNKNLNLEEQKRLLFLIKNNKNFKDLGIDIKFV